MFRFEYMSLKINHISHSIFISREISRQIYIFGNMNFFFIEEIVLVEAAGVKVSRSEGFSAKNTSPKSQLPSQDQV